MWNNMEWIVQGLPPPDPGPLPQALGPGLLSGEGGGEVTAASSGPVIAGVWEGCSSPPQPPNFSGLLLPFSPAELGAWAPLTSEGPLCLNGLQLRHGRGCHWLGLHCSVAALMAGEDVEVAVSPRVVGGNALQDDVSGGERSGGEPGRRHVGTATWPQGPLNGRPSAMSYLWAPSTRKTLVSSVISWVTWEVKGH